MNRYLGRLHGCPDLLWAALVGDEFLGASARILTDGFGVAVIYYVMNSSGMDRRFTEWIWGNENGCCFCYHRR